LGKLLSLYLTQPDMLSIKPFLILIFWLMSNKNAALA
jgi:hypothetical protein